MTTDSVVTHQLSRSFGSVKAVDAIDLEVRAGEVYGFLGANGAGKTTTLRMLVGLARPTSGKATVLGRPPGDPRALARTGILIEEPALYPYLSGRDNLAVVGRYTAVGARRVEAVLETVGLAEAAAKRVSRYSLGMRQRLGVGMALLKDPELLVLDEPANGLDPAGVVQMRELLAGLASDGRTVLLSSHALSEVGQICDRVGILAAGRLVAQGTLAEVRGEGALLITAEPQAEALDLLRKRFGPQAVRHQPPAIALTVSPDQAASVNRQLNDAGLDVSGVSWQERSMAEAFFDLTAKEDDR
ncbi:ABC transporter ATP-binding protein [Kribbella albertanoniae]|uniref:ABC transporter ATP-binding protein n=1 Tax=Kribbella albertanoniae TaxID=1266829 RepID=A0A4R4QHD0_9ACTN|nr:ABC transporter ATP-binding protein [Kribbella albertanoniae]TDC35047.1 ABC transporter ATP-binding protein [Kribbella albertanoniae]